MSAVNRVLSKSARLHKTCTNKLLTTTAAAAPRFNGAASRLLPRATTTTTTSAFHTMASLQSAAAAAPKPSEGVGYDPEIKDIANYIHNYAIDSDLAVSLFYPATEATATFPCGALTNTTTTTTP